MQTWPVPKVTDSQNWQEEMSKGRSCKSAICCFVPRSFQLQQDPPGIFPTAVEGWGPKGEACSKLKSPSYLGIEIQSENHQHSSRALEEAVLPLFLYLIANEGVFF